MNGTARGDLRYRKRAFDRPDEAGYDRHVSRDLDDTTSKRHPSGELARVVPSIRGSCTVDVVRTWRQSKRDDEACTEKQSNLPAMGRRVAQVAKRRGAGPGDEGLANRPGNRSRWSGSDGSAVVLVGTLVRFSVPPIRERASPGVVRAEASPTVKHPSQPQPAIDGSVEAC